MKNFQLEAESGHITSWRADNDGKTITWAVPKEKRERVAPNNLRVSAKVACHVKLYSYVTAPRQVCFKTKARKRVSDPDRLFDAAVDQRNLKRKTLPDPNLRIFTSTFAWAVG